MQFLYQEVVEHWGENRLSWCLLGRVLGLLVAGCELPLKVLDTRT